MTLFTRLATTALLATVALGSATPVMAHHTNRQPFVESETVNLLSAVRSVGVHVVVDGPRCERGLMGMALMTKDHKRQYLLICAKNHGDDLAELADTIRHESIHVAQHCRVRRLGLSGNRALFPDIAVENIRTAANRLHMPMQRYNRSSWAPEAEARVGAHVLDEHEVATLVRQECSR